MLPKKYTKVLQNDITDCAISLSQLYEVSSKAALSDLCETKISLQLQKKPDIVITTLLDEEVAASQQVLFGLQSVSGYWLFPLETDTTITSEYILLGHFIDQVDRQLEGRLVEYICSEQLPCGGWPIYRKGPADISASVKAYFALKMAGHSPDAPHMRLARQRILELGGAENVNVFTRIALALFGQLSWRTVPAMLPEIVLLPKWFFFNLDKVSYWSRTVIAPLLVLIAYKPVKTIPSEYGIAELFKTPPHKIKRIDTIKARLTLKNVFILFDEMIKLIEPYMPKFIRKKALNDTYQWINMRMGEGGLGGIYPAMANALMMLHVMDNDHPQKPKAKAVIDNLVVETGDKTFCQPCVGHVWDTCLSLNALLESGASPAHPAVRQSIQWLMSMQITDLKGDWARKIPHIESGGWCFQHENDYYPDVDDASMVLMALFRAGVHFEPLWYERLARGVNWILGMQSTDGGWAAFDMDNNHHYLNNIPFADHGALIDPSTSDVTARCVEMLAMLGYGLEFPPVERGVQFLVGQQEKIGAWYGRWGINYIYGTWSVLSAFGMLGFDTSFVPCKAAVEWLKSVQNPDGGWGESCASYNDHSLAGKGDSMPSVTAWALLGLMAVGQVNSNAVEKGVRYLLYQYNRHKGAWNEELFNGTGFPRVFYLRYTGYSHIFPLWALGVYRRLKAGRKTCQQEVRLLSPISFK
jgi:squalene-hopene/tetraprenyl-beta-curcumene cyclase